MKKYLFTGIAVLISVSVATAQTEKGRWAVGTSIGNFRYSSQYGAKTFSGSVSPSAGYFVADNLVVGAGLPLSLSTAKYAGFYNSTATGVGASPFVRYYLGKAALRPYIGIAYAYSTSRLHIETNTPGTNQGTTATGNGYTSSVAPVVGVACFINHTVAVNAGLSYVWQHDKSPSVYYDATGNLIDTSPSNSEYLTLGVGFQLFFGK